MRLWATWKNLRTSMRRQSSGLWLPRQTIRHQEAPAIPWYQDNLCLAAGFAGIGILVTYFTIGNADFAWLLAVAGGCFAVAWWAALKRVSPSALRAGLLIAAWMCSAYVILGLRSSLPTSKPLHAPPTLQRAYVQFDGITIDPPPIRANTKIDYTVWIENPGPTLATNVQWSFAITTNDLDATDDTLREQAAIEVFEGYENLFKSGQVKGPRAGGGSTLGIRKKQFKTIQRVLTEEDLRLLRSGKRFMWLVGKILYTDETGPHLTNICRCLQWDQAFHVWVLTSRDKMY